MQGHFSLFLHGPADSFVDLPPLWRDTQTTGSTSGHQHFCRASITPNAPKISPGVFSPENGGSCSFLSGVSTSGEVIFARTTDKSRYLVLFASSNNSEHLEMWGFNTDARLRIGIVGSEQTYGCFRESHMLSNPPRPKPAARGIFFQNRCVAPPDSGTGPGILVHNSVGEKFPAVKLLSVFSRFLGVGAAPRGFVETVGLRSPHPRQGGRWGWRPARPPCIPRLPPRCKEGLPLKTTRASLISEAPLAHPYGAGPAGLDPWSTNRRTRPPLPETV